MYRLIVSGSRYAKSRPHLRIIRDALVPVYVEHREAVTLVHGDAPGVDRLAAAYVRQFGWAIDAHPAAWTECGDGCPDEHHRRFRLDGSDYCPFAGPRRNEHMCSLGADGLAAFPESPIPDRSGTWNCLRAAARHGIPSVVHPLSDSGGGA